MVIGGISDDVSGKPYVTNSIEIVSLDNTDPKQCMKDIQTFPYYFYWGGGRLMNTNLGQS